MKEILFVRGPLLLYVTFLTSACPSDRTHNGPIDAVAAFATDPIAFVGHGAIFDSNGNEIEATAEFVTGVQQLYLRTLLGQASNEQSSRFDQKQKRLLGDNSWDIRSKLYANAELIDWLV